MNYLFPYYYRNFRCAGGACPLTCCGGWEISIDPASLRKYRRVRGPLGTRLQNEIDWKRGCFRQYQGTCAFLNEEKLCDLYSDGGGETAFCRACRIFPRHMEEFRGLRELSLSLSCPVAAGLILSPEPVQFCRRHTAARERLFFSFDRPFFERLFRARAQMIRLLQNREQPLRFRFSAVLTLARSLQKRLDKRAFSQADRLICRCASSCLRQKAAEVSHKQDSSRQFQNLVISARQLFSMLERLEPVQAQWPSLLKETRQALRSCTQKEAALFRGQLPDHILEQLMIYFLFTYFCGAVYDGDAEAKVRTAFGCTVMICVLSLGVWLCSRSRAGINRAAENSPEEILLLTACRFSREAEHSDRNLLQIEAALKDNKEFNADWYRSMLSLI